MTNNKVLAGLCATILCLNSYAQHPIDSILHSVLERNTTLKAWQQHTQAQALDNQTTLALPNPEVGYNFLVGQPSSLGQRQEWSVAQSLDVGTLTGKKKKLVTAKNILLQNNEAIARFNLLLEVKLLLLDLIYEQKQLQILAERIVRAEAIVAGQEKRLKAGDARELEVRTAQLHLKDLEVRQQTLLTTREKSLTLLSRYLGGDSISFTCNEYPQVALPPSFAAWKTIALQQLPTLKQVGQALRVAEQTLKVEKTATLPSLSLGYQYEKSKHERFQGITIGLSIPLWKNKRQVKQAKAALIAAESDKIDAENQWEHSLLLLYREAVGWQKTAQISRITLSQKEHIKLLQKALEAGEISVLDFNMQVQLYDDAVDKALDAERNYQKAVAQLYAYELPF